jgi:hypothetical protein
MAHSRHLPLYAAAYAFTKEMYRLKTKLPKALKYELGQEAFHSAVKTLKCIVIANRAKDKAAHIVLNRLRRWSRAVLSASASLASVQPACCLEMP